jgi:hypothetical protein
MGSRWRPSSACCDSNAGAAGVVRYGTGWAGDRHVDGLADALEQREHGLRPARAVEAHDRRAVARDDPAGVDVVVTVVRHRRLHAGERHHRRQAEVLADVDRDQRLADVVERLGDDEVDAFLDGPAELLLVLRANDEPDATGSSGSYDHVLQMLPATSAPPSRATSFAILTASRFSRSRSSARTAG